MRLRIRAGWGEEIGWIERDNAPFFLLPLEPALHHHLAAHEELTLSFAADIEQPIQLYSLSVIVALLTNNLDRIAQRILRRQRVDVGGELLITRHRRIDCPQEHFRIAFAES